MSAVSVEGEEARTVIVSEGRKEGRCNPSKALTIDHFILMKISHSESSHSICLAEIFLKKTL